MNLIKQTNINCMAASFAMILGISLEQMEKDIGHDGSVMLWPECPEKRVGHHIQELMDVTIQKYHRPVSIIDALPHIGRHGINRTIPLFEPDKANARLMHYLNWYHGVVVGLVGPLPHAVAWNVNEMRAYDPSGFIRDDLSFMNIEQFLIVHYRQ